MNIFLKHVCVARLRTHIVRGRPTPKREIGRFRNGLVRELKVNEKKLLRQSKALK